MLNSLRLLGYCALALLSFYSTNTWAETKLTAVEMKWLRAGWPVLVYAERQGLPIDIIAQTEAKPDDLPLAMGFADGRCKLVLSMRGNTDADAILANVSPEQTNAIIEAVTAHEVAHCWRYAHGIWHTLPAGFVDEAAETVSNRELAKLAEEMRATRREEGFADLVGLAWTASQHPEHYAAVHDWFEKIRKNPPVAGSHHDTGVWIALAKNGAAFSEAATPFEQVQALWDQGLLSE